MEAILKFILPEEQYEFDIMSNANRFFSTIHDFKQYLRNELKHNDNNYTDEEYKLLEKIREHFNHFCIANDINHLF